MYSYISCTCDICTFVVDGDKFMLWRSSGGRIWDGGASAVGLGGKDQDPSFGGLLGSLGGK